MSQSLVVEQQFSENLSVTNTKTKDEVKEKTTQKTASHYSGQKIMQGKGQRTWSKTFIGRCIFMYV